MSLDNLIKLSEEELLIQIAMELNANEFYAIPPSNKKLLQQARSWIDTKLQSIKEVICTSHKVKDLATNGSTAELASAVLGLIESLSLGTAATPLAAYLCKKTITIICEHEWNNMEKNIDEK